MYDEFINSEILLQHMSSYYCNNNISSSTFVSDPNYACLKEGSGFSKDTESLGSHIITTTAFYLSGHAISDILLLERKRILPTCSYF